MPVIEDKPFEAVNDLTPMVKPGQDIEPIALVDTSGSNSWPAVEGGSVTRWEEVTELFQGITGKLAKADSQAEHEEEGGGIMTITFASPPGNSHSCKVVGDINPANFAEKWGTIEVGGGTYVMPGWELVMENYMEEFGDTPVVERPVLGILAVTDGEMSDLADFTAELGKLGNKVKVVLAVHGYGSDHEAALAAYREAEKAHPESLRVIQVVPNTTPDVVADAMLSLLGLA